MKIVKHKLKVQDFTGLSEFYCDCLGMQSFGRPDAPLFGFDPDQCLLEFRGGAAEPFEAAPNDFYWKIGITLRDLDAAIEYLRQRGLPVPDPYQFRDIGYMTKLRDPNGFIIELLQQGFEGNSKPVGDGHPVGAQATLAHITLRITDLAAAQSFFGAHLGMRLMSIQPVDDLEFCLYFYAWSEEPLPHPDLKAAENREWLWARSYTLIELQHLGSSNAVVRKTGPHQSGFDGFAYEADGAASPCYVPWSDLNVLG